MFCSAAAATSDWYFFLYLFSDYRYIREVSKSLLFFQQSSNSIEKMLLDLQQKTYFLITGASRGIGQTLALKLSDKLGAGSVIVLLARNQEGLNKTKSAIDALGKDVQVKAIAIDLSKATAADFAKVLTESLSGGPQVTDFQRALIVHNAGTVGDVSKRSIDVSDTNAWTVYYHTNVFSAISLNCEFFKLFTAIPKVVVNISSKCGIEPFASMSFYCSGKAARNMYFRVLAVEEAHDTLVLNYGPGAIDTDMTVLVQRETINSDLSSAFKQQRESKTMLTTEQTTGKLIQVLEEQKFNSGDYVDYWD